MKISHQYKFVFLGNPQSGSTSINKMLDSYSDISGSGDFPFHHHATAKQLAKTFQEKKRWFSISKWHWDKYLTFTTVRNLWEKMVARYFYGKRNPKSAWNKFVTDRTFDEFVQDKEVIRRSNPFSMKNFIFDGEKRLVKHVIKIENIQQELPVVLREIGLPELPVLHINERETERAHYSTFYKSAESIEIVRNMHLSDIEMFNYVFEEQS